MMCARQGLTCISVIKRNYECLARALLYLMPVVTDQENVCLAVTRGTPCSGSYGGQAFEGGCYDEAWGSVGVRGMADTGGEAGW